MSAEQAGSGTALSLDVHNQLRPSLAVIDRTIPFNGREFTFGETADFDRNDPWSQLTRDAITTIAEQGGFTGRTVFEAGTGDGRNRLAAGAEAGTYVGVDTDEERISLARDNFLAAGLTEEQFLLEGGDKGDVVWWLGNRAREVYGGPMTGWGIACLPQAPLGEQTVSEADGYDPHMDSLHIVDGLQLNGLGADVYGLKLNAAFLQALRENVAEDDFDLLITLSDRVPPAVLRELIERTGWEIAGQFPESPWYVQQDPDTSTEYVQAFDDGERFYRHDENGNYTPIPATVAEAERQVALATSTDTEQARDKLNVYHRLSVFHLRPRNEVAYES